MDIKKIIENFEQAQNDLNNRLNYLKNYFSDEEKLWTEYEKLDNAFFLSDKTISFLCDSLQQVDQKEHLALFNLQDVKYMYKLLTESHPDNIQYQEDFIAFVYNVLDDESEVLLLINKFEQRMDIAHEYFEKVKEEIKNR